MYEFILKTFITLFVIIDPLGIVPVYITTASSFNKNERKKIILKAGFISSILIIFFSILGGVLLRQLGIMPGSFYIAGGILLFILSLNMIFGHAIKNKKRSDEEKKEIDKVNENEDISVFPLSIPMICGPGTIASLIMLVSHAKGDILKIGSVILSGILIVIIAMIVMFLSDKIIKIIGKTGINILDRLMGIILSALAIQFVYNGVFELYKGMQ